ncbi:hypothetical protein BGZ63DRAFT_408211 [Mariannaea sp. PMI_226]|nr:hypothetical protein BGZ63DRAFT_408211 [Mariannaea sp. PMI_226]
MNNIDVPGEQNETPGWPDEPVSNVADPGLSQSHVCTSMHVSVFVSALLLVLVLVLQIHAPNALCFARMPDVMSWLTPSGQFLPLFCWLLQQSLTPMNPMSLAGTGRGLAGKPAVVEPKLVVYDPLFLTINSARGAFVARPEGKVEGKLTKGGERSKSEI